MLVCELVDPVAKEKMFKNYLTTQLLSIVRNQALYNPIDVNEDTKSYLSPVWNNPVWHIARFSTLSHQKIVAQ